MSLLSIDEMRKKEEDEDEFQSHIQTTSPPTVPPCFFFGCVEKSKGNVNVKRRDMFGLCWLWMMGKLEYVILGLVLLSGKPPCNVNYDVGYVNSYSASLLETSCSAFHKSLLPFLNSLIHSFR